MVSQITVQGLNRLSRHKEIWCIGCGKRLNELLNLYKEEIFIQHISKLLDNDRRLWGIKKKIGSKTLVIAATKDINEVNPQKTVIIITSDHVQDIYKSVEPKLGENKINCFMYPKYYSAIAPVILSFVKKLPLKRQLLFYAGSEPHENADEITEYLLNDFHGKRYNIYYLDDGNSSKNNQIKYINKWSVRIKTPIMNVIKYFLIYGRAKYLFYENEPLEKIHSGQKLIFLNHGTIPLKDVHDVLKQPLEVDYAICPGTGCASFYEKQYGIARNKQIYMMPPRVYKMLKCKNIMNEFIAGSKNLQLILWLPTFRQLTGSDRIDSEITDPFSLLTSNWQRLNEVLIRNGQLLLIKKHPHEKDDLLIPAHYSNIRVILNEDMHQKNISLQEILKGTDALITDYSGIAFEYMLLDRPIGYIISDIEKYYRGFSVENPLEFMPGMKIKNYGSLETFLNNVKCGNDNFSAKRQQLVNLLFGDKAYDNGAKALIKFIDSKI